MTDTIEQSSDLDQAGPTSSNVQFGEYKVFERIGQGGMCLVLRARHAASSVDCALKVLRAERRNDERVRDLFITEADLALLVEHPNLIRTYDAGEVDGRYYIAMELVEGGTLFDLDRMCAKHRLPIPPDVTLFILGEVLHGLHALHETRAATGRPLELVHRDVTPHNIFLSSDGRVILGDLGVAMVGAHGEADPSEVLGKLGYLAPEMLAMEDIDRRADLFAVGVVAYELLTGTLPFTGRNQEEVMNQIGHGRFVSPRKRNPAIHPGLDAALTRALARRPEDRFFGAEDMLDALKPYWSSELANAHVVAALVARLRPSASPPSSPG